MSEISEQKWLKAGASNPVFDFLGNPEEDIYTQSDGKPMNEKPETWYVFDMNPEHVDPRLPQWLEQHGIVMKVNAEGKNPGVIANTFDDLPEYCHPIRTEVEPVSPLKIALSPIQRIPSLRELVDHHNSIHGKPYRLEREPLVEDFGRGAKLSDLVECLQGWLSEILVTLRRIDKCDDVAFNGEGAEEIEAINEAIASLQTQYFEATSTFSDEDVKANVFRFNTEEARKQQEHE